MAFLETRTPLKRSGFKSRGSLSNRSAKKDGDGYQFNSTFKKPVLDKGRVASCPKARAPLKQCAPIKAKREEPRRQLPDRTKHERVAPKASDKPTAIESQHMDRVAKMRCLVCNGPSTLHHVTGYADRMGRITRSHQCVVPLCAKHHQKVFDPIDSDPVSVEGLGHQKFYQKHGKDLFAIGNRLWEETLRLLNHAEQAAY